MGTMRVLSSKSGIELVRKSAFAPATDVRQAVFKAAQAAESKKAHGTVVLDVSKVTVLADYFLIAGGDSANQVRAIVDAVDESLTQLGYRARSVEGKKEGRWVLLDYGDIIVHVLHETERSYYKLEQFWNQALIVERGEWEQTETSG